MITFHKTTPVHQMVVEAIKRTEYGPGKIIGGNAHIYPAIQAVFYFDNVVICRIEETELWVRHDEIKGIHTLDGLLALGRSLDDILYEMQMMQCYVFELPEETEELEFDFNRFML